MSAADVPDDVERILLDEGTLARRVGELALQISADYQGRDLVLLGVLKGAVVFLADLMRAMTVPVAVEFVSAASYGDSTSSSGEVTLKLGECTDLRGRDVLIVEDIVDTGQTLSRLAHEVAGMGPASLRICCLLDKPSRRKTDLKPDYTGFEIPDLFVVGYGLDFAQKHRDLPYVAVLKPQAYRQ
ncbi:MAG: hypoxanthine phosphoribosyltransferase [Armatimonadetes bacterium]|nr:hypoxanthine phosphoribosyltransferase [Armatimonadota bacterium]